MTVGDPSASLTIHSCPPHRVRSVATILEDRGLIHREHVERRTLLIGLTCTPDLCSPGDLLDLADDLIDTAPEVSFTVYEDPTDEWLGSFCRYVPGLGRFVASTDHDGDAVFTAREVLELDQMSTSDRRAALGVPWSDAIAAMPTGDAVEPQPHGTRWDPASGEITVLGAGPDGADVTIAPACVAEVDDDGNLADTTAADIALAGSGFLRVNPWEALNVTCRTWGTDVYLAPEDTPGSARSTSGIQS